MNDPVSLVALALVTIFILVPLIRGVAHAMASNDAWAPFETHADGRAGVLAPGRYFSALCAPRAGRTTTGLVVRWGFWIAITVVLVGGAAYNAFAR